MSIAAINVRNQFRGKVKEIVEGPVVSEIDVETAGGLIINLICARLLHRDRLDDLNMRGAWLHVIGDALGRRIAFEEMTPEEFRSLSQGTAPGPVVDMLLAAWSAAVGQPAYVTTAVAYILGTAPRTFRQWAADHATAFTGGA